MGLGGGRFHVLTEFGLFPVLARKLAGLRIARRVAQPDCLTTKPVRGPSSTALSAEKLFHAKARKARRRIRSSSVFSAPPRESWFDPRSGGLHGGCTLSPLAELCGVPIGIKLGMSNYTPALVSIRVAAPFFFP